MSAAIVLVYLYLLLRIFFENQKKMFKTSVNARPFNDFFQENPREYPHQRYVARNWNLCRRFAPLTTCLSLLVFTQLFFDCRTVGASQTGAKTEFNAK